MRRRHYAYRQPEGQPRLRHRVPRTLYELELPAGYSWRGRRAVPLPPRPDHWQDWRRRVSTKRRAFNLLRVAPLGTQVWSYVYHKPNDTYFVDRRWEMSGS